MAETLVIHQDPSDATVDLGAPPQTPTQSPAGEQAVLTMPSGNVDQTPQAERFRVQIVDISEGVEANAADRADQFINEKTTDGGNFLKRMVKRIWYGNIARDYYLQREKQRGRQEIIESQNLYVLHDGTKQDHERAATSVVRRFTSDYEGMVQSQEKKEELSGTPEQDTLRTQIEDLIDRFASSGPGGMGLNDLREAKNRLIAEYGKNVSEADRKKGLIFADNIVEVAVNAKAALEHGIGMDAVREVMTIHSGEALVGVRSKATETATDRLVNAVHASKAGSLVNETTLALGAGVAMGLTKYTASTAAGAGLRTLTLGAGAGVVAGAREHARIARDRSQHIRAMAEGGVILPESKRRDQLEETRYRTVSATDLARNISRIQELTDSDDPREFVAATELLIDAVLRDEISTEQSRDLLSFSSKLTVESERFDLRIAIAKAKVALRDRFNSLTPEQRQASGFAHEDFAANFSERANLARAVFVGEMSEKDAAFKRLQRNETVKKAVQGAVTGMVIGAVVQEGLALLRSEVQGLFEHDTPGLDRRTELAAIFHRSPHYAPGVTLVQGSHVNVPNVTNAQMDIPPGYSVGGGANGVDQLVDSHGNVVVDLHFTPDGHLDDATRDALTVKHFTFADSDQTSQVPHTTVSTIEIPAGDYQNEHPELFTSVHRGPWLDNNTPRVFDQNELRMDWGGENGTGIDADGNYVFNVSRMTADGSSHGDMSADWHELARQGNLKLALSMSRDGQSEVFFVPFDENGNAIIDPNSPMGQSLFLNQNGHAEFIGAYAETAQVAGVNADGETLIRPLATVVGSNQAHSITETINVTEMVDHEWTLTQITAPVESDLPVEVTPVLPIYGRKGLERLAPNLINPNLGPMYYGGKSLEEIRSWIQDNPSRLHTRRQIVTEQGRKMWAEADGSPVERSVDRERAMLRAYLDEQRERNDAHYQLVERVASSMAPMHEDNRVSVNVPAWMEEANLKHFLEEYTSQTNKDGSPLDPNQFEVNILVNRRSGTEPDGSVRVIEDFISEFESSHGFRPAVNYYDVELEEGYSNVGYARKLLTDATILRSLQRSSQSGVLYIESEDADMVTVDKNTVRYLISKLDRNPQLDAVRGVQDRAPQYMKDNDFLLLRRRAWDVFELLARQRKYRDPSSPAWNFTWNRTVTGGWNTAYTAESYAMIGGYDVVEAGEDMSVGEKITMCRGDGSLPNLEVIGSVGSRSDSSPRRFIDEILTNEAAYDDFQNEETNKRIREQSLDEAMQAIGGFARINDSNKAAFEGYVSSIASWVLSSTPDRNEAEQMASRILHFLGFKKTDFTLDLQHQRISVENWDNVKAALENYRSTYSPKYAPVLRLKP